MAYEAPRVQEGKPNTWKWATNLAERVRNSKIARGIGGLLLAKQKEGFEPRNEDFDSIYPKWRQDPRESQYKGDMYVPTGRVYQAGPEQINVGAKTPEDYARDYMRPLVRDEQGNLRYETPAEVNKRLAEFTARNPGVGREELAHFEETGHRPIMVSLEEPVLGPPQRIIDSAQPVQLPHDNHLAHV